MGVRESFELTGRVAIVTGGSRGIGLQMAEALGEMGAKVAIAARRQDELDAARAHLEGLHVACTTFACDLAEPASARALVDHVLARWKRIDVLVNNAGCNWAAPAEDYPDSGWRKVMALNLDASFLLAREVARRAMIPARSGKVINVASIAGLHGNPPAWKMGTVAYNASKGALVTMTKALAAEWGRHGVNVNAICPGFFRSRMTDATLDRIEADVIAATPLGRLGGDDDLKGAVVFLASGASRHVTGHALVVDGGCSVT